MPRVGNSFLVFLFGSFLGGCSFFFPAKENKTGQRSLGISFELAESKEMHLAGENLIPLSIGLRIEGLDGFTLVRHTRVGEVIDLEVPVGELKIAASFMGFVGAPADTIETFCAANNDKPDIVMGSASLVSSGDQAEDVKLVFQVQRPAMQKIPIMVYSSPNTPAKGARVEYLDAVTRKPWSPCVGERNIGDDDLNNSGLIVAEFPIMSGARPFLFDVIYNGVTKSFQATTYSDHPLKNLLTVTLSSATSTASVMDPDGDFDNDGVSNTDEIRLGTNPMRTLDASLFKILQPSKQIIDGKTVWSTNLDFAGQNLHFNAIYYSLDGGPRVLMDWKSGIRFESEPSIGSHTVIIDALDEDGYKVNPFTKTFEYAGPVDSSTQNVPPTAAPIASSNRSPTLNCSNQSGNYGDVVTAGACSFADADAGSVLTYSVSGSRVIRD